MGLLVTFAVLVALVHLWSRVNKLQQRVDQLEQPDTQPYLVEPATWEVPAEPEISVEAAERRKPAVLIFDEAAAPSPAEEQAEPVELVEPEPEVETQPEPEPEPGPRFGFEELFGRRLPIWAGGITLAVAGMLIVKYSIDAGLVSPLVRVISGLLFGTALIGAAEWALRADEKVRDPRVRQALAGAGVASLYGAILIAANVYELVGPVTAFLGMAAVTALAMGLSLRFGAPSALLGLAGGLAAPALVGSGEPNIPLLATYLALAVGGLAVLSKSQRWMWLGIAALTGGFGWAAVLLFAGGLDAVASVSLGLYIFLLGIVLPMVAFSGRLGNPVRIAGSVVAAAQMAGLVASGGFTLLHWGLFGLISAAIVWLSRRDERLARLPAVGLAMMLLLLAAWPDPEPGRLALVMLVGTALYGVPALLTHWRPQGTMVETAQLAALGLGGLVVPMIHFFESDGSNDKMLALVAAGASLIPAGTAALGWRSPARRDDSRFALLSIAAALLVAGAILLALPAWTYGPAIALLGLCLLGLRFKAGDLRLEAGAWAFAAVGILLLAPAPMFDSEMGRLFGDELAVPTGFAPFRWATIAAVFALFAWKAGSRVGRGIAQAAAALLAYCAVAQLPLGDFLPLVPAIGLVALAAWSARRVPDGLLPGMATFLVLTLLWALEPLFSWSIAGVSSLFGDPMLWTGLPEVRETLLRLLVPAALVGSAWWLARPRLLAGASHAALGSTALLGGIALHIIFKQIWSIEGYDEFVRSGLAERTAWEALLLGAALLAWRFAQPKLALGLTAIGLAHFGLYSLLLHNPLFDEQAVGPLPVANLLVPAYGLPLLWLWLLGRREPALPPIVDRIRTALPMLLVALFAFSTLRQLFHGSILAVPGVTAGEDIFRSIVAIALAIGFLFWGIYRGSRDWRIGSLAIMLAAVAKVFLLDASGLDGLLRIASFVALGLSLIGIGWLYSRYLGKDQADLATAEAR